MKQFLRVFFVLSVVVLIAIPSLQAYDVNKDLKNLGPDAHDLAVVLSGSETVTSHYDGYPIGLPKGGKFGSFAHGPNADGNTVMHWQNFKDGKDTTINTGQVIHVGWSTSDHSSSVIDMYWTGKDGQRLPGSVIFNLTSNWRYEQSFVWVNWLHEYAGNSAIEIRNVHFAVIAAPIPLDTLNTENAMLDEQLQPLPGGENFEIVPGEEVSLQIPEEVMPGSAVVLRYEVLGTGSDAESLDFVQFVVEDGAN